jgi:hypothetical protein
MAYANELLELAQELANLHPDYPHQPSLRRAVSTAYYALFHLLISEATANWQRPELRAILGRVFDHGPMKQAADKKVTELNNYFQKKPPEGRRELSPTIFTTLPTPLDRRNIIATKQTTTPPENGI